MKKYCFLLVVISIYQIGFSQTYNIAEFGAMADNKTINTRFIQNTIDSCAIHGGGMVYIPAGVFITGTIHLKSNVNLHLESGARLKGSADINQYEPYRTGNYDTTHYGILFTLKAENVSITGQGTIDGNEEAFFDWKTPKKIEWGGTQFTRQGADFRKVTSGIGDGPVNPLPQRPRQMVIFSQCKNVLVENVLISKSPFWTLHFADCDGVTVKGVKIWNSLETPNSDGLDITSCTNVNVSDCDIRAGDDAIAITGYGYHYELPGYYNLRHLSENINITNCNLQSRSSGIRIGFEDQNTVRNINICNITITNSNRGIGIFVRDSGSIENVTISQVFIETRLHTGDWWGNGEPIHISALPSKPNTTIGCIKNITFRDITCRSENGILVYGSAESIIQGLIFENVKMELVPGLLNQSAGGNIDLRGAMGIKQLFASDISAFYGRYVSNLKIIQSNFNWGKVTEDFFKNGIYLTHYKNVQITDVDVNPSPSNSELPAVLLENGDGLNTNLKSSQMKNR